MGLAKRIIPTLCFSGDKLIKDRRFAGQRSVGHVVQAARVYGSRGADEIVLLDITASREGRGPNLAVVEKIADSLFTPLAVGGGVRSVEDVRDLLNAGADKIIINTAAIDGTLIGACADRFGSQAIVASVDYRIRQGAQRAVAQSYGHAGTVAALWDPRALAVLHTQHGAGEILLTCIDNEGEMGGYELELLRLVAGTVSVPVVAHGGCGTPDHALEALRAGASAVGIGSMFAFTDETPRSVAQYLHAKGVEVRIP